jgi:hypothetical protein
MKTCKINWTKKDMARVICQALFNAEKPLPAEHFQVKRMMRKDKAELQRLCEKAIETICQQRRNEELECENDD